MLKDKFTGSRLRLEAALRLLPLRTKRLLRHLGQICPYRLKWWAELYWLIFDLIGLPELYETLLDFVKWNSRPLTIAERKLLYPLFGDSINYERVRIDENAWLGPPQWRICYVSFYTINNWGPVKPDLLVHEMVHIWQFTRVGSVYIPRALRAQRSIAGYNYGGPPAVHRAVATGFRLLDFNYEQQGDLVADYWRLKHSLPVQWGPAGPIDMGVYQAIVAELQVFNHKDDDNFTLADTDSDEAFPSCQL